jgi:hypothetical protein
VRQVQLHDILSWKALFEICPQGAAGKTGKGQGNEHGMGGGQYRTRTYDLSRV